MKTLQDRVFAITGAGSGIGQALAGELARLGTHVAISDIDAAGLAETKRRCERHGVDVHDAIVDVSHRDQVYEWAETVFDHFGRVHGIVNNAGVSLRVTVEDMEYDDFEWLMEINFWGVVYGTKAFLPWIRESGQGHVVNISSVFGIMGIPTQSAYNAAKFAVRGFTESLRAEMLVEDAPIGITCVHPGGIQTDIVRNGRIREMSRFDDDVDLVDDFEANLARTSPEHAAKRIIAGIRGNKPRVLIGLDAQLIDKAQRILPTGYQRFVAGIFRRQISEKTK
jgi:NAD(P)-dependent dehydrogenase (short-subunit alcohol dehydrogenase family)